MYPSDLILIVLVACLKVQSCGARPYDTDDMNAQSDNGLFKYKLPTELIDDTVVIINGTLNKNQKMFTAKLPSQTSQDADCMIVYDFQESQLKVKPASSQDQVPYNMDDEKKTFNLRLKARNQIIDFQFEGNDAGPSDILACKIKNFQDISGIVIEGIENVDTLLFEFPK
ncbi:uncharacterized protein LOC115444087 [Manduca sexta]|uniref:uncharacterized protein LOC115444087 n=1 Tax=Manduca sexta TaxID=7130 RepID=UPI0011832265|nr:uncharacterized protein LOC115444087 [Manduca sexta]